MQCTTKKKEKVRARGCGEGGRVVAAVTAVIYVIRYVDTPSLMHARLGAS